MVGGFGDEDQVSPPQIRRAPATAGAAPQVYERLNLLPDGLRKAPPTLDDTDSMMEMTMASHPFAGLWVTEDGYIRHQLLPNGRYVEARGHRERPIRAATRSRATISTIRMILVSQPMASFAATCCTTLAWCSCAGDTLSPWNMMTKASVSTELLAYGGGSASCRFRR